MLEGGRINDVSVSVREIWTLNGNVSVSVREIWTLIGNVCVFVREIWTLTYETCSCRQRQNLPWRPILEEVFPSWGHEKVRV